jgi:hypothetical protein
MPSRMITGCGVQTGEQSEPEVTSEQKAALSDDELTAKALNAYIYGYTLVVYNQFKKRQTNVAAPDDLRGIAPINQLAFAPLRTSASQGFPLSNVDTLQTFGWLDLTVEPMVLQVPNMGARYYLLPIQDAWGNVIASPGSRTTGQGAQSYVIVGPNFHQPLPDTLTPIYAPTSIAVVLGRTEVGPGDDYAVADALRRQTTLVPLSSYGQPYTPPPGVVDPTVSTLPPAIAVGSMDVVTFFDTLAELLIHNPPVLPADAPILVDVAMTIAHLRQPDKVTLLASIPQLAASRMATMYPALGYDVNGWRVWPNNIAAFGTDYDTRAAMTRYAAGTNLVADTVYPQASTDSSGQLLNGANAYTIHFEPGLTPPVHGFWSITMYNQNNLLVANPANIYAVGNHRSPLQYNPDGSLDLYVQSAEPASGTSNWLPAPAANYTVTLPNGTAGTPGSFNVMMRMYWPNDTDPSILDRTWQPPPLQITPVH